MTSHRFDELDSLLFDWEDGTLDQAGLERLRSILREDDAARDHYAKTQLIGAAMKLDSDAGMGSLTDGPSPKDALQSPASLGSELQPNGTPNRKPSPTSWGWRSGLLIMAMTLLLGVLLGRWMQPRVADSDSQSGPVAKSPVDTSPAANSDSTRDASQEATTHGVALVTRLVDVQWGEGQDPLDVGDAVSPGHLKIAEGFAQVEFFCGATVVIEGPADLDLRSPMLAKVHHGRMRAQVPPAARGFSLEVADMTVVDLGTEFGLSVSDRGANVQVFDGEVELQQPGSEKRLVTAGNAVTRTAAGNYQTAKVTPDSFLNIAAMESRAQGQRDERFQHWANWSADMRQDDRLIAYYAFDQQADWGRRLSSSLTPTNSELDGAIVGAKRVPGRWADKSGLEFKHPGDRVRFSIPGEYTSLTFACWVKIDSLDRWYNSLFLTDNYNQGEPHWQILDTGQLFFSVRWKPDEGIGGPHAKSRSHHPVLSPPFWKPSMSGRWLHLATTYDAETGHITHYLNGSLLHEETIPSELRVKRTRIGAASIGNWSLPTKPDSEFAIRNLNGSIDEFAMFSAALTANEIQEIYQNGKP